MLKPPIKAVFLYPKRGEKMTTEEHYKQHLTEHYNLLLEMTKDMQMGELSISDMLKIIELKLDIADKLYRLEKEVKI